MSALSVFLTLFFILSLGAGSITIGVVWTKKRRLPLLYGLLIIIVFFCLFAFLLLSSPHGSRPNPSVQEAFVTDLDIRTTVQPPPIKDQSTQVNVSISQLEQLTPSPGSTAQPTVGLTPIGTPGMPIVDAFGPGYNVSVIAQLSASAFDIAPQEPQEQSLDQPTSVTFSWTATPRYAGRQALEVTITGKWTPVDGGPVIMRPLAAQTLSLDVADTSSPFISFGQLDLSQLLIAFLSSALNVPWIVELIKKKRASGQKKATRFSHATKPSRDRKKRQRQR